MQTEYRGIPDLYDAALQIFDDIYETTSFYEWLSGSGEPLSRGQLCVAVVSFIKTKKWYLEEHNYIPLDESESTWYARQLTKRFVPPQSDGSVKKYFEIGKDEALITSHCKVRPVVLLDKRIDNWWNPLNRADDVESWICVPVFSYKPRHNSEFVIADQILQTSRFYLPVQYDAGPGMAHESAVRPEAIQSVVTSNLKPLKCYDPSKKGQRPYRLSPVALKLLNYHIYSGLGIVPPDAELKNQYSLFCELLNELLDKAVE